MDWTREKLESGEETKDDAFFYKGSRQRYLWEYTEELLLSF